MCCVSRLQDVEIVLLSAVKVFWEKFVGRFFSDGKDIEAEISLPL